MHLGNGRSKTTKIKRLSEALHQRRGGHGRLSHLRWAWSPCWNGYIDQLLVRVCAPNGLAASASNIAAQLQAPQAQLRTLLPSAKHKQMSKLTLRYRYDSSFADPKRQTDDFGRLSVEVETDRFSGKGGFWVQWQDVKEFGEALSAFPITTDHPVAAQWGYDMQEGEDLILRLEIAPANKRGDLAVRFEIADDHEPDCRTRGWFTTNYPDLDAFRVGIGRLMDREVEEAILFGR